MAEGPGHCILVTGKCNETIAHLKRAFHMIEKLRVHRAAYGPCLSGNKDVKIKPYADRMKDSHPSYILLLLIFRQ